MRGYISFEKSDKMPVASRLTFATQHLRFLWNHRKSRKVRAASERETTHAALKVLNKCIAERVALGMTCFVGRVKTGSNVSEAINRALNVLDQVGYRVDTLKSSSKVTHHFGFPGEEGKGSEAWIFRLEW